MSAYRPPQMSSTIRWESVRRNGEGGFGMFGKTSSRCQAAVKATRSRSELRLPSVSGVYTARGAVQARRPRGGPVEAGRDEQTLDGQVGNLVRKIGDRDDSAAHHRSPGSRVEQRCQRPVGLDIKDQALADQASP